MATRKERRAGLGPSEKTKAAWAEEARQLWAAHHAAHAKWVEWMEALPEGAKKEEEKRWALIKVKASEAWGSDPDPEMYLARIRIP